MNTQRDNEPRSRCTSRAGSGGCPPGSACSDDRCDPASTPDTTAAARAHGRARPRPAAPAGAGRRRPRCADAIQPPRRRVGRPASSWSRSTDRGWRPGRPPTPSSGSRRSRRRSSVSSHQSVDSRTEFEDVLAGDSLGFGHRAGAVPDRRPRAPAPGTRLVPLGVQDPAAPRGSRRLPIGETGVYPVEVELGTPTANRPRRS